MLTLLTGTTTADMALRDSTANAVDSSCFEVKNPLRGVLRRRSETSVIGSVSVSTIKEKEGGTLATVGDVTSHVLGATISPPSTPVSMTSTVSILQSEVDSPKEVSLAKVITPAIEKEVRALIAAKVSLRLRGEGVPVAIINEIKEGLIEKEFRAYLDEHVVIGKDIQTRGREYVPPLSSFAVEGKSMKVGNSIFFLNRHYIIKQVTLKGDKVEIKLQVKGNTFRYHGLNQGIGTKGMITITAPKDKWEEELESKLTSIVLSSIGDGLKAKASAGNREKLHEVLSVLTDLPDSEGMGDVSSTLANILSPSSNIYDASAVSTNGYSFGGGVTDQVSFVSVANGAISLGKAIAALRRAGKREECGKLMEALGLSDLHDELKKFNEAIKSEAYQALATSSIGMISQALTSSASASNITLGSVSAASSAVGAAGAGLSLASSAVSTILTTKKLIEASKDKHKLEALVKEMREALIKDFERDDVATEKATILTNYAEGMVRALAREQSSQGIIEGANVATLVAGAASLAVALGVAGPAAPAVAVAFAVVGIALMIAKAVKDHVEKKKEAKRQDDLSHHGLRVFTDGARVALEQLVMEEVIPENTKDGAIRLEEALGENADLLTHFLSKLGVGNREQFVKMTRLLAKAFVSNAFNGTEERKDFFSPIVHTRMASAIRFMAHRITGQLEWLRKTKTPFTVIEGLRASYESKCQEAYRLTSTCSFKELKEFAKTNKILAEAIDYGLGEEEDVDTIRFTLSDSRKWLMQVERLGNRITNLEEELSDRNKHSALSTEDRTILVGALKGAMSKLIESASKESIDTSSPLMKILTNEQLFASEDHEEAIAEIWNALPAMN